MDARVYTDADTAVLRAHARSRRNRSELPVLVFSCGGAPGLHPARDMLKDYVDRSASPSLHNVLCVNAEPMARMPEFADSDLLTQEALVADAADCIILFAESAGSFCELGAFAALPTVLGILTVALDRRHAHDESFLNDGPVRMVRDHPTELSKVLSVDLECPTMTPELTAFLSTIRCAVAETGEERKRINLDQAHVRVGPYVLELLDIVNLLAPVRSTDVEPLYRRIKGFRRAISIESPTIMGAMRNPRGLGRGITTDQVLALMRASGMIAAETDSQGAIWLAPAINPEHSFMFKDVDAPAFQRARAGILLRKRRMGTEVARSVYRRFDER